MDRTAVRQGLGMAILVAGSVTGGCAAPGTVDFTEVNFKRINAGDPLSEHLAADATYWWVEGDRLMVAMQGERSGLPGQGQRLVLSFDLAGLPAEDSRDYQLDRRSMRAYASMGTQHRRFASLQGLLAVWREGEDGLRGRFRLLAKEQQFHVLTGWADFGQAIMTGEFHARRDAVRGAPVLRSSEERGMERGPVPTSGPAPTSRPGPRRIVGPPPNAGPR